MITATISQDQIREIVDDNIQSRHAVRAFLPKEVPKEIILEILDVAKRAPSGINTQPWKVYVIMGAKKEALSSELIATYLNPDKAKEHVEDYHYYPKEWTEPYLSRRREMGAALYGLLGIAKGDEEKMRAQHARNYEFFGAPIGLFFTIDRVMQQGSFLDYGMFVQNVMLAAKARGLDTCPQAAFNQYHAIVSRHLNFDPKQQLVCAMSLGYADTSKVENSLLSNREPVESFTQFVE